MYLSLAATFILSSFAMANNLEGARSTIARLESTNSLPEENIEIAAIALGYPLASSSDWVIESIASRAIMTKINIPRTGI
jgi:hypothetical protein